MKQLTIKLLCEEGTRLKNTLYITPLRGGSVKNNQGAYVSKNEAYALAQTVKDMFAANGIEYEVQQTVCKERSPEISAKVKPTGIEIKIGFTWKTATVTTLTPRGGIFDD